jgi:hypothetical protein
LKNDDDSKQTSRFRQTAKKTQKLLFRGKHFFLQPSIAKAQENFFINYSFTFFKIQSEKHEKIKIGYLNFPLTSAR